MEEPYVPHHVGFFFFVRVMKVDGFSINICSVINILYGNVIKTFFGHQFSNSYFDDCLAFGYCSIHFRHFSSPIFSQDNQQF